MFVVSLYVIDFICALDFGEAQGVASHLGVEQSLQALPAILRFPLSH
jgi:hypothetical protein